MDLVVFGAGGHGKVVADILLCAGRAVAGFVDDTRPLGEFVLGLPVLGGVDWLKAHPHRVALGVGDNRARQRIALAVVGHGSHLETAIHPRATISRSAFVGAGAVVMANAVVNPDARIERGAIVNTGAIIEHDCLVGAFAHVSPGAALAGACRVGELAHLGVGAAMLPQTSIGDGTVVGGGAVVARDLPSGVVATGVPARVRRPA